MITSSITIKGITPLLINRFHEEAQEEASSQIHSRKERLSPEEDAKGRLYWTEQTGNYFPAENLRQSLIAAGSRHKIGRKAASYDLAAALYIAPFCLPITGGWKVDTRPVVIPATKGRILRHRPIFDEWEITFELNTDERLVDVDFVKKIVQDAGDYIGIGDFRPARKGVHGRFTVVNWQNQ